MTLSARSPGLLLAALVLGLGVAPGLALAQAAPPASASAPASAPAPAPAPASAPASAPAGGSAHSTSHGRHVIPGSAAPGVYALVPPLGAQLPPTAFATESVNVRQSEVEACFKGPAGLQCLQLLHPSAAKRGDQHTKYFAVRAAAGTDPALAAAVLQSIRQHERESPWLAVEVPGEASTRAGRRSPFIIGGVVLLLLALWFGARAAGRRAKPGA